MISKRFALPFALAVLLAGCAKKQETATTATQPATPAPVQAASTQPPAATAASTPAQPKTAGAIASTDGEKAGTRVDITELKRTSGGTLNLKFVLINNGERNLDTHSAFFGDNSISKDSYRDISGVHLIDPVNKKKYFVVTDAERRCVCSKEIDDIKPGSQANVWAKFPAPPLDVQKVTIEIPHFQPIDDVPISQ